MTLLPLPFTPSTPPSLGPVATCAAAGADPAAPAGVSPTLPRGILPNDLVTVDGRAGQFLVRAVVGEAVEVVAGGCFWSVPLGAVHKVQ